MGHELNWMIGGEAGAGIKTTGLIFSKLCTRGELNVFDRVEYPSLIRGGHNAYYVRASDKKIYSTKDKLNLLIALNKETIKFHIDELGKGGGIIYDSSISVDEKSLKGKKIRLFPTPLKEFSMKYGKNKVMMNTVALGATVGLIDYKLDLLLQTIEDVFAGKKKIIDINKKVAEKGYEYAKTEFPEGLLKLKPVKGKEKLLITGNEAVCLGALKAGVKFHSQYPMTPSSSILHYLKSKEREADLGVIQTEDEIAAINMALGASYGGLRSMVATSGGGFSLMTEAVGLSGMTETPVVIVQVQRPGPSTGLPTHTGQSDLRQVMHASQGEFPRVVIAPGDPEECFYLTGDAFNIAEKYQLPVILLLDKHLGENNSSCDVFDAKKIKIDRGKLLNKVKKGFKRYEITKSGISPRSIPGQENGIYTASGNEHDEVGNIIEDPKLTVQMNDKRMRKLETLKKDYNLSPKMYGPKKSEVTLIGWGSTKGAIMESLQLLEKKGIKANFIQFIYLFPFPDLNKRLIDAEKSLVIENNITGQLAELITQNTGMSFEQKLLKYDGRCFFPEHIADHVEGIVQKPFWRKLGV